MNYKAAVEILNRKIEPVITVFGDYCLDKYLCIDAELDELSVETGLVAYQVTHQKLYAGAAGTITNNLRALGARVICIGIVGMDGEGWDLMKFLEGQGADTELLVKTDKRQTCTYIKPMRSEGCSFREMNRLDIRNFTDTPADIEHLLIANLEQAASRCDAIILCDQFVERNKSAVTDRVRDAAAELANKYPEAIWYVDSRGHINEFRNMMVKCNHKEIAAIFGESADDMAGERSAALAERMYRKNERPVIVTMGERGSLVYNGEAHLIPAFPVEGETDICGAGDAFNAGTVFALTLGASLPVAAAVGNACSSMVIKQIGVTGTANVEGVKAILEGTK